MMCLLAAPWVQLSVSVGNGWPHNALRHHWLMPISCHFRDCKTLLVTSLTHTCKWRYSKCPNLYLYCDYDYNGDNDDDNYYYFYYYYCNADAKLWRGSCVSPLNRNPQSKRRNALRLDWRRSVSTLHNRLTMVTLLLSHCWCHLDALYRSLSTHSLGSPLNMVCTYFYL